MDGRMKLPANFKRVRVFGHTNSSRTAANGWNVCVGNKAAFVPRSMAKKPGAIRRRLEAVLGIKSQPERTPEDRVTAKSRHIAALKRAARNRINAGTATPPPWSRPRTLSAVLAEERTLSIALKWQRMGEFRR